MNKLHVKKGDTVVLLTGDREDKYVNNESKTRKTGKVLEVSPSENKVIVEGINMITKHVKPGPGNPQGGIVQKEAALDISNVMLVVDGKATRVGFKMDGDKKVRVAKATGKTID